VARQQLPAADLRLVAAKAIVSLGNLWMMKAVMSDGATAWVVDA
jgi:hypothetical protein